MTTFRLLSFLALIPLSSASLRAGEVSIELPQEKAAFKSTAGSELAQAFCVQCHSVEYISFQPPMPRKFWEASVLKMKDKYGAPIPAEMVTKLTDYLVATYGVPEAAR